MNNYRRILFRKLTGLKLKYNFQTGFRRGYRILVKIFRLINISQLKLSNKRRKMFVCIRDLKASSL